MQHLHFSVFSYCPNMTLQNWGVLTVTIRACRRGPLYVAARETGPAYSGIVSFLLEPVALRVLVALVILISACLKLWSSRADRLWKKILREVYIELSGVYIEFNLVWSVSLFSTVIIENCLLWKLIIFTFYWDFVVKLYLSLLKDKFWILFKYFFRKSWIRLYEMAHLFCKRIIFLRLILLQYVSQNLQLNL